MRWIPKKTERLLAAAAIVALPCISGCKSDVLPPTGERRDVPPQRGGVLRTAFFVDVRSLDAAIAFDTASGAIEYLIYDRLVSYDERGKLTPQLAERIDTAPDNLRYTFTLRRGIRFHDGSELKADDVKRSIERALHPKTPCPVPSYYERLEGYAAYHDGKAKQLSGVRVEGDYVVSFSLSRPDATFLHLMALPIAAPLCKSAGRVYDRNFSRHACGTGPFKLVKYENGDSIRVVRHEGYWDKGKPYLDAIEWSLNVQSFAQRFKFEQGDLDYMRDLSEADSLLFRNSSAWQGLGEWESALTVGGSFMNNELPPFNNRHFRRAIAFAIKREQIAAIRPGHVVAHGKIVPDALIPTTPDYPQQRYDYQRALEEMKLAGYPYDPNTGQGGYPEEIPYLAILDSYAGQAAEIMQQQLKRIGVRIRIRLVGFPTWLAQTSRRKTVGMGYAGWNADFPDPSTFFEPTLSSKSIQEEESQNLAFFSNERFDALVDEARDITDEKRRLALYRQAEQIIADEAPWATAYSYRYFELWQPYVHGYRPNPVMSQYVRNMWFDRGGMKTTALPRWLPSGNMQGLRRGRRARTTLALALRGPKQ